jgi:hypothetical protein
MASDTPPMRDREEEEVIERDPCENCGETALQVVDVDVRVSDPKWYWAVYTVRCPTCEHEEDRHVSGEY